jgi:hypothetical protein
MKKSGDSTCARCGGTFPADELDATGWCAGCRARVIRRATLVAIVAVFALAVGLILFFSYLRASPQFLVLWTVLGAGVCFVLFKLVRRVAFEAFLARTVANRGK